MKSAKNEKLVGQDEKRSDGATDLVKSRSLRNKMDGFRVPFTLQGHLDSDSVGSEGAFARARFRRPVQYVGSRYRSPSILYLYISMYER